jgi:DNA end-binding protein Ku
MASVWSGTIGFGLVQIPVALHPAEDQHEFDMTMLDKQDLSPVGYKRVNKTTDKEVEWSDIVKGYEHTKNQYVILTPADFAAANVKATRQVDIMAFVGVDEIDPRYIERPYYVVPQKTGIKAYALLRETLRKTRKVGIGRIVMRTRQHLAALLTHDDALLLVLLRFSDELRDTSKLSLPDGNLDALGVTDKERTMAQHLVEALVEPFTPENYVDEYHHDLLRLIERKVEAGEVNTVPEHPDKKPRAPRAKAIDLAALLAQSVDGLDELKQQQPANENIAAKGGPAKRSNSSAIKKTRKTKARNKRPSQSEHKPTTRHRKSA